jgi:hypothetical protein
MAIYHTRDNCFKLVFDDHQLFVEFIRDFIPIDMLKNIQPEDIEDLGERYLPLFQDSRESDTIKRINLKAQSPLFVIALIEHESTVNFRSSFKMLQYICLILDDWEKEQIKQNPRCIYHKDFKYPPVLPVVFYDGPKTWTAEKNFRNRTAMNGIFAKYIPSFEYELVDLHRYSPQEIARFNDVLSLVLLIDRLRPSEGESLLQKLPPDYFEQLQLKIPENLSKLLSDVITVLLKRKEAPSGEIAEISGLIERKEVQPMFEVLLNDYRQARRQGRREGRKEGEVKGYERAKLEMARKMKACGDSAEKIREITGLPPHAIVEL